MFVYQKGQTICVTFKDNKPVAIPEYEIVVDETHETITINGTVIEANSAETEDAAPVAVEEVVEVPVVEETTDEE